MEVVRNFNNELSSLYECKPPISKAKMTEVTKAAIKGIKFYKHIVQSVEKFVQKCRPEFKVPGLYVIDSIVRQSRHQFGTEKDVFAPRFTKNITLTFQSLFKCPPEERPKIVRVLNLWQKNNVFPSEVIQPLLDMANPNAPTFQQSTPGGNDIVATVPVKQKGMDSSPWKSWNQPNEVSDTGVPEQHMLPSSEVIQEPLTSSTNKFKDDNENSHSADANLLTRLQQLAGHLLEPKPEEGKVPENTVKFNKKLLDFDYSDEEEEEDDKQDRETTVEPNELALSMAQNLLSNPELLRQLQQMQQTIQQTETLKAEHSSQEQFQQQLPQPPIQMEEYPQPAVEDSSMSMQSIPFPEEQPPEPALPPYSNNMPVYSGQHPSTPITDDVDSVLSHEAFNAPLIETNTMPAPPDVDERFGTGIEGSLSLQDMDLRPKTVDQAVKDKRDDEKSDRSPRSQSSSQSRSRSSRRHRSRSRSPRRKRSRSRSASRSRSSHKRDRHSRSRSREREKERDRERKSRGLPPIKKNHVGVFSTTLWLGHLSKNCSEDDLRENFGEFGPISSIEMILPRGCAFVCMEKRSDAQKALQKLRNLKLQGTNVKIAWAPGTGVKGKEYKDYWDVDLGTAYIPFEKLPPESELHFLEKGGVIDEDALPEKYKEYRKQKEKEKQAAMEAAAAMNAARPPNMMQPGGTDVSASLMASSHSVPMMPPPVVQSQFGMSLPGMMPPQHMMMPPVPMGVPPPNPMLMVPPTSQSILGAPLPVIPPLPSLPLGLPPAVPGPHFSTAVIPSSVAVSSSSMLGQPPGDATPTEEDGTSSSVPATSVNTAQTNAPVPQATPSRLPPMGTLQSLAQPPFGPPPPPPPPFGMHPVMPQGSTNSLAYPPPMGTNFSLPNRHPPPPPPPPPQMPPPQNWRPNSSEAEMRYPTPVSSIADGNSSKQSSCYTSEGHAVNSDSHPPLQTSVSQHPPNLQPASDLMCGDALQDMPLGMEDNKFNNYSGNSQQMHTNFGEHGGNVRGSLLSPNRSMINASIHQDNVASDSMRGPDFHRENIPIDGPMNVHQNMPPKIMGPHEPQHRPMVPPRMHDPHGKMPGEMRGLQHKEPILPTPDNFGPRGPPPMRMRGPMQNSIRGPSPRGPMPPHFGRGPRPNLDFPPRHGPGPENSGNYRQPPRRWNGPGPEEYPDFGQKGGRHNQPGPGFRGRREYFGGQQYGRGKPKNRFRNDWDRNAEDGNNQNKRFNEQWPREERDWRRFRDEMYFGQADDRNPEEVPPQEEFYNNRSRFPSRNRNFDRKDRDNRDSHDRRGFRKYGNFDENSSERLEKAKQQKQEESPALEAQNMKIGENEVGKEKSNELNSTQTEVLAPPTNSEKTSETKENKGESMEVSNEIPSEPLTNG